MAPTKDIATAVAFLQRFDFGEQPSEWLAPVMMTAEQLGIETDDAHRRAPLRLFSHEAAVIYLVDQGDHYDWIDEQDMESAGLGFDELHQIGTANLGRLVSKLRLEDRNGVLTFQGLAMFEASMVLCTPLWESEQFLSRYGLMGPIVTMPRRDTLAVCVRGDHDALTRIRRGPEAIWTSADPDLRLCKDLYAMTIEGAWLPYKSEHSPLDGPPGNLPASRRQAAESAPSADMPLFAHLLADLSPEQRVPLNPTPSGEVLDPRTPIGAVGGAPIEIPAQVFNQLDSVHFELLFASGYSFNPDTGKFFRACVGEPGAPVDPWTLPEWQSGGAE